MYLSHLCRYCCQTWLMQMMMNQLLKLRFALGLISFLDGLQSTFVILVFMASFVFYFIFQEEGSQPDRDQV